jgi:lipopolysaccharide/colanic/teichoic acid biosynthesis glycosyltransferase
VSLDSSCTRRGSYCSQTTVASVIDAYHEQVKEVSPPAKVVFDRLLSLVFLVVTLPVSLVIAAAIAIENVLCPSHRGGVFHSELRVSAGRPFRLYKFRILTPGGEQEMKEGAMPKHVENTPGNLTIVGAALKRIGLDEMPQFLNVLGGEMSLVGPRPKPPAEYKVEIESGHEFRAQLQAGLTGPAQVLKGTVRTAADSVRADQEYADLVRNGSQLQVLAYDARTLLKTVRVLFRATGE